jgi:hypothetical protein
MVINGGHVPMHVTAVALIDTHSVSCTWSECRYLQNNQLTGTLPAAWSALAGLNAMWVPRALLICA